jgi:superfamily II DNA or RNA helicase
MAFRLRLITFVHSQFDFNKELRLKQLRDYQKKAKGSLIKLVETGKDRALVVLAAGLGKTVLAAAFVASVLRQSPGHPRALFMVHMRDIVLQAKNEFDERMADTGLSTGIHIGNKKENVDDCDVLLATLQSINTEEFDPDTFDLIVVDEAHHSRAETYEEVITYFEPKFRLGMTATPDRHDGLDIRDIFGEEVYNFSLSRGLDTKWLADVDYYLVTDNLNAQFLRELKRRVDEGDRSLTMSEVQKHLFADENLAQVKRIVENRRADGERTVIYCRDFDHLEKVQPYFPDAFEYHSKLGNAFREEILDAFRAGEIDQLLAIDALNEGVDIPELGLIVFLRSTSSEVVWKQQLGRGLRNPSKEKTVTALDFVGNCDRILKVAKLSREATSFRPRQMTDVDDMEKVKPLNLTEEEVDLMGVFERLNTLRNVFYKTLAEAKKAVQDLDPVPMSRRGYMRVYKQDPKLPRAPYEMYPDEWVSWYDFLGTGFYETLAEAKEAVQDLYPVPTTYSEYKQVYKQDPKLPNSPDVIYSDKWVSWHDFLQVFYETLAEAKEAVQDLDPVPTSSSEYKQVYKQDPKLPSDPDKMYPDEWVSWYDFLGTGFYETLAEAKEAVRNLKPVPTTKCEYKEVYKQDSKLPSAPDKMYPDEWVSWPDFLGTAPWSYEKVKSHIQGKGFRTVSEYRKYARRHPNLRARPQRYNDYEGADVFLGKNKD